MISREPLISLENVNLRLGERAILERINLSVERGEIVTLVGPNGAGKSSLLKIAIGLLRPQDGKVHRAPNLKVGYVPQRLSLDPVLPMTARRLLELTENDGEAAIAEALRDVGAQYMAEIQIHDLSGGEVQRLLLARALLRNPDLLILDEPLQGVDLGGQIELFALIEKLRTERGCGVIMVSHDLHLVMANTDRVVCLNRHICCSGRPESVAQDPAYLALFGASSASALAVYHHHHDHEHDLSGACLDGEEMEQSNPATPNAPPNEEREAEERESA